MLRIPVFPVPPCPSPSWCSPIPRPAAVAAPGSARAPLPSWNAVASQWRPCSAADPAISPNSPARPRHAAGAGWWPWAGTARWPRWPRDCWPSRAARRCWASCRWVPATTSSSRPRGLATGAVPARGWPRGAHHAAWMPAGSTAAGSSTASASASTPPSRTPRCATSGCPARSATAPASWTRCATGWPARCAPCAGTAAQTAAR